MGEVHKLPTACKRSFQRSTRGELPPGVVRLNPPERVAISPSAAMFPLLCAILTDMTGAQRLRIAETIKRQFAAQPWNGHLEAADDLLYNLPFRLAKD